MKHYDCVDDENGLIGLFHVDHVADSIIYELDLARRTYGRCSYHLSPRFKAVLDDRLSVFDTDIKNRWG